jgi:hypothetical protein
MRCAECVGTNDCPMTHKCVDGACKIKCMSDTQCTSMGLLCDLTRGVCSQCVGANDCRPEQYCASGTCAADICTAGTSSCENNAVVTCRSDGSGFGSPLSCGSQVCVPSGTTAACKDRLCTPAVVSCNPLGEQVIKCAADGLSGTVVSDCAAMNQVCVAAQCVAGVCPPGKRFCMGQDVRQCSVKGDTSTPVQTCLASQFCEAATGSCKTKVCTASQPACNGRISTTCNADGSGYMPGGNDCSPKYCSAGNCVDYLFHEDFEDGDLVGWTNGTGTYTRTVTSMPGTAGAGTNYSLYLAKNGGVSGNYDGVYQLFGSALTPSSVSWWVRIPSSPLYYAGNLALFSSATASTTYQLFRAYFYSASIYVVDGSGTLAQKAYSYNIWYHLEMRNISWLNRTYDLYIDNVLVKSGALLGGSGYSISRIDLYDYYPNYDFAYFDQIDFLP